MDTRHPRGAPCRRIRRPSDLRPGWLLRNITRASVAVLLARADRTIFRDAPSIGGCSRDGNAPRATPAQGAVWIPHMGELRQTPLAPLVAHRPRTPPQGEVREQQEEGQNDYGHPKVRRLPEHRNPSLTLVGFVTTSYQDETTRTHENGQASGGGVATCSEAWRPCPNAWGDSVTQH